MSAYRDDLRARIRVLVDALLETDGLEDCEFCTAGRHTSCGQDENWSEGGSLAPCCCQCEGRPRDVKREAQEANTRERYEADVAAGLGWRWASTSDNWVNVS